jgi:DNA-directed RNA polymerase specialized sigma24 family protein
MTNKLLIGKRRHEDLGVFDERFWRCYRLLYFIACRILGDPKRVETAIENCWLSASRNPPQFEYEGEFRSWLLRVLIDEAVAIRRGDQGIAAGGFGIAGLIRPKRSDVTSQISATWRDGAQASEHYGCR